MDIGGNGVNMHENRKLHMDVGGNEVSMHEIACYALESYTCGHWR